MSYKIKFIIHSLILALLLCFYSSAKAQCVTVFPHVDDFETAPTWTAYTAPTSTWVSSDWAWGAPNHTYVIQSAGSGTKCWSVGTLTGAFYNFWEQSYVQSPCYNFTNLQYPHVKFKLFYDSEYHYDGGNLQSSIDGGTTWQDVGTVGGTNTTPIPEPNDCNTQNWYNFPGINYLNNPVGFVTSKHGWCGNTQAGGVGWDAGNPTVSCVGGNGLGHWVTAEHCLLGLAGQPNVLLRFTFGAGYTCNNFDGLAFDSVAVSNGIINTTTVTSTCGTGNTLNFNSGVKACPTTTWAWNFGDAASGASNTSTAQNPAHTFSGPGTYTVSVIASGGACNPPDTATKVVHIMNVSITSYTNATCTTPGAATALATGGTAPTYSWSNGDNTGTATGLTPATYTVTVTDPNACPTMTTVTIAPLNPIVITLTYTPSSCGSNNGTATAASVTGGTGAGTYSYSWTPTGGTGTTANNLYANTYTLTVTDANSCTGTQTVQVTNSSGPTVTVASTSVSCNGGNNGSITVTATGGTAPITYSWSTIGLGTATLTALPQGTYTVVTTDASPCSVTNVITIAQPSAINAVTTSTAATCGQSNGTASVTVTGGTPGYTYTWSPTPTGGVNTSNATGCSFGTYTVSGVDANTCTYTAQVTVTQQSAVNVAVVSTPASCGNNNGTATATASGGFPSAAGYTYTWSPIAINTSTNVASNLAPSVYTISVGDSLGCTTTKTVTVGNHPSPILSITSTNITCNGFTNGSATVSINAGTGTSPFTYTWSPAAINTGTNVVSNLGIGTYSVNLTDSATCTATTTVTINQPSALTVTATSTLATCGNSNGTTSCTATGGTPNYTYIWIPSGGNNATATNLAGNITYTVTVKDANNCVDTVSIFVNKTPALMLSIPTTTNVTCNGGNNGAISVNPQGGTAPFTYTWSPATINTGTNTASNLSASVGGTTYTVFVTDSVGCTANANATIIEPTPFVVTATGGTVCLGQQAYIGTNFSGGNGAPYTFTWTSSDGINIANTSSTPTNIITDTPTITTTYTIAAQDSKGCPAFPANATVLVLNPLNLVVTTNDTVCPGKSATLSVITETGGLGAGHYSVTWLPSGIMGNSITVNPNSTTTYTAVLSDGCTVKDDTTTGTVYTYPIPLISYTATPIAGCAPLTAYFSPAGVNNIVANSWSWNFGDGFSSSAPNGTTHTYTTSGVYHPTLHGTTTQGCADSSGVVDTIRVYPQPKANFTASAYVTDVYDNTIHFTDLSTGQISANVWNFIGQNFSTNVQNPTYTFFPEGTYSVSLWVINQFGCKDSITQEIIINPVFTFYAPNCVTPNGDGLNEVFLPEGTGWDNSQFELWIFDRWGIMFHHTTNPYGGWDGTKDDHKVQEDTYVWKVNVYDVFGNPHQYQGIVSVVR
ncbi:MAG: PKD domain-containing protein [Bacteroidia bacterium]